MPRTMVLAGLLVAFTSLTRGQSAEAQLGGIIKKKVNQATATTQSGGQQVTFNNVVLEITPARVNQLLAAKQATKQMINAPNGLAAIQTKVAAVNARQTAIYEKEVDAINAWDEKRRAQERCLGEALSALQDQRQSITDPQTMQKLMQLAQALAAAQARGDTAEVRRIAAEVEKLKAPTRADTLAAEKQCGQPPAPSPIVQQWLDGQAEVETLTQQLRAAEDAIRAMEARMTGMDDRQIAMLCERLKMYLEQLRNNPQKLTGFTPSEQQTLASLSQTVKDLEALCP